MNATTKLQEIIVDVTEEEFRAELEQGFDEDEVLHPGRHLFRRGGFLARHGLTAETLPASSQERVTLTLDSDVITYFRERAARPNAAPYQAQINAALREAIARDRA